MNPNTFIVKAFFLFLPVFFALIPPFSSPAQIFSGTRSSREVTSSFEAGVTAGSISGFSETPGVKTLTGRILSPVVVYQSENLGIRYSYGKLKNPDATGSWQFGQLSQKIAEFTLSTTHPAHKIPLMIFSDILSWKKPDISGQNSFYGTSAGLQTGYSCSFQRKLILVDFSLLAGAGFGLSSFNDGLGSQFRASGLIRFRIPEVFGWAGLSVTACSGVQRWNLDREDGRISLLHHELTAGVCW